jgi:hypothetical protein
MRAVAWVGMGIMAVLLLFYLPFFHYTDAHEVGIKRNQLDGTLSIDTPGFNITAPWIFVAKMETRPQRVCVESAAKVINCKLAIFRPTEYLEFVQREGFRYYWWDNRISFNSAYAEEYRGSRDLIRGYAFSTAKQNFVEVIQHIN